MQARHRDVDIQNRPVDTVGEGEAGKSSGGSREVCAQPCTGWWVGGRLLRGPRELSQVLCDNLEGKHRVGGSVRREGTCG